MEEHALDLLQLTTWLVVGLLVVVKALLLIGFTHLTNKLKSLETLVLRESDRMHSLEIRITKIEVRLGIANGETNET